MLTEITIMVIFFEIESNKLKGKIGMILILQCVLLISKLKKYLLIITLDSAFPRFCLYTIKSIATESVTT